MDLEVLHNQSKSLEWNPEISSISLHEGKVRGIQSHGGIATATFVLETTEYIHGSKPWSNPWESNDESNGGGPTIHIACRQAAMQNHSKRSGKAKARTAHPRTALQRQSSFAADNMQPRSTSAVCT